MKITFLLSLFIFTVYTNGCSQKKEKFIPLLGLQDSVAPTANSSGGSSALSTSPDKGTLVAGSSDSNQGSNPQNNVNISPTNTSGTTTPTNSSTTNATSSEDNVSENATTANTNTSSGNTTGNNSNSSGSGTISLALIQPSVTFTMESTVPTKVLIVSSIYDSHGNTIVYANIIITGINADGQTILIYSGSSTALGEVNSQFTIPTGITSLNLVVSVIGNNSLPVTIPVSLEGQCKADNDRGHGNDLDGIDEDNTGNSTGVNSNAMDNRKSNGKKKDTCNADTKYLSNIGSITLSL